MNVNNIGDRRVTKVSETYKMKKCIKYTFLMKATSKGYNKQNPDKT